MVYKRSVKEKRERKGKEVKPQLQRRRLRRRRLTRRWKKCNPVRKKKRQKEQIIGIQEMDV